VRAEADHYKEILATIKAMHESVSKRKKARRKADRLRLIGVGRSDKEFRNNPAYSKDVDAVFDTMDLKADIAALEARKAEGEGWRSADEADLKASQAKLVKAGAKLEQLVDRERASLKREADKMKTNIARLEIRVASSKEGSSAEERYSAEKWKTEALLFSLESADTLLVKLATWKAP